MGEAAIQGELLSGGSWRFERVLRQPAGSAVALTRSLLAGLGARDSAGNSRWHDAPLLDLALTVGDFTAETGRQATIGNALALPMSLLWPGWNAWRP